MRKILAAGIVGVLSLVPLVLVSGTAEAQVTDSITCESSIAGGWDYSDSNAFATPIREQDFTEDGLTLDLTGARAGGKNSGYVDITDVKLSSVNQTDAVIIYSAESGPSPGYQLRVHPEGDSTWAGHLVYEGGGKWWATRPLSWPLLPNAGQGAGYTLSEYSTAYPNATVSHVGFSLGSGVTGKGLLKTLTFQGTRWVFGKCAIQTTTTSPSTTTTTATTTSTDSSTTGTSPSPTSTTTETSSSSSSSTTTSTTNSTTGVSTSGSTVALVPVGNNTDDLASTGASGIGAYIAIGLTMLALGGLSFFLLYVNRRRV
jgi:LPXTG-motif cell wall-anchored protein